MNTETDALVVWLHDPQSGTDPETGEVFRSTRHIVFASKVVQDAKLTTFLDDDGVIYAEWATADIQSIEWRRTGLAIQHETSLPVREASVGSVEWRESIKKRYPRAYLPWSPEEDDNLRAEHAKGLTVGEICANHQRQPGGIRSRLVKLGLVGQA